MSRKAFTTRIVELACSDGEWTQSKDAPAPEVLPDVPETAETEEQPSTDSALDVYDLDQSDVSEMASDLQKGC